MYKYSERFPGPIPQELMNREIAIENVVFRFITPKTGLFKAHPPLTLFKNRTKNYFPSLLGEIELSRKGTAQITLRFPLPTLLIILLVFAALVISNTKGTLTITSILPGVATATLILLIFGAIFMFRFLGEKEDLQEGFRRLKEHAKNGTLVWPYRPCARLPPNTACTRRVGVAAFLGSSRGLELVPAKWRCLVPPTRG